MLRKATLARSAGMRAKYAQRGLDHRGGGTHDARHAAAAALPVAHGGQALRRGPGHRAANGDDGRHAGRCAPGRGSSLHRARSTRSGNRAPAAGEPRQPAHRAVPFTSGRSAACLYLEGRHRDAIGALSRASRWGTTDKPLYQAQLALARIAAGEQVSDVKTLRERLAEAPCGQGYGRSCSASSHSKRVTSRRRATTCGLSCAARPRAGWRWRSRSRRRSTGRVACWRTCAAKPCRRSDGRVELDRRKALISLETKGETECPVRRYRYGDEMNSLFLIASPCVVASSSGPGTAAPAASDAFTAALTQGPVYAALAALAGGLLVSLTPCVYPMIAITVSVFGARQSQDAAGKAPRSPRHSCSAS